MNDNSAANTGQVSEMSSDSLNLQSLDTTDGTNHLGGEDVQGSVANSEDTIHMHVKYCIG